jgi:hypothetical protein
MLDLLRATASRARMRRTPLVDADLIAEVIVGAFGCVSSARRR